MKSKILKDKTKKMLETGDLPYTHRPYIGFDSYVLTYEESLRMSHQVIFGNFGTGKESLVYALHRSMEKINPVIIGNGIYHWAGAASGVKNKCLLSIPLNGVIFEDTVSNGNIAISGIPAENIFAYMERTKKQYYPSYLDTYKSFCNLENITSSEINLEYGDFKFLFNPILTIEFEENVNEFYTKSAQCIFEVYAFLRYSQYQEFGKDMVFNFCRNEYASSLFTLLAHPNFEYKVAMPSNYSLIGTTIKISDNLFKNLNFVLGKVKDNDERFNSLLITYGEIWELFLVKQYDLAVIKSLGFFEYFYKCKRLNHVPGEVAKNISIKALTEEQIIEQLSELIKFKNQVVHEGKIEDKLVTNYGESSIDNFFDEHKKEIYFLLDLFGEIIVKELV